MITPNEYTRALTYVDDIAGMGKSKTVEIVGKNSTEMEERKKFEFNLEKTQFLKVEAKKRKKEDVPHITLSKGKVKQTTE